MAKNRDLDLQDKSQEILVKHSNKLSLSGVFCPNCGQETSIIDGDWGTSIIEAYFTICTNCRRLDQLFRIK